MTTGEQILDGLTDVVDLIGKLAAAQQERDAEMGRLLTSLADGMSELVDQVGRLADEMQRALDQLAVVNKVGVRKVPRSDREPPVPSRADRPS